MYDAIVRCIRVGFRVVDARADVVLDVRTSDELDAESPALLLGEQEMISENGSRCFEVCLVGVEH